MGSIGPVSALTAPCLLAVLVATALFAGTAHAQPRTLDATDFGLRTDGMTDDGPAIARLVAAARAADGPVVMRFPEKKTIRVKTVPDGRYVFPLGGIADLTLDGGGCVFVLDPYLRFMSLTESSRVVVRNLSVDFDPLPFVDGAVAKVDAEERFVEVQLPSDEGTALTGGPTGEDGEQAFFASLWDDGPYGPVSRHYWTARVEPTGADTIRVYSTEDFKDFDRIQPESTRISVPVPGIAHRYGPGPCFRVHDNEDVTFQDVELWSAPWFGFNVRRNRGKMVFRRVNIRPKPGTDRLMSLWRDGFHVKGNAASLLWEDCIVSGMNDDAFNISTHSCVVRKVLAPDRIVVGAKFPLGYIPWHPGATLNAADETTGRLLPSRRVVAVAATPMREINGKPAAPASITLTLDAPAPELVPGVMVWDPAQANPDTLIKNCTIEMSCRLQSPVRLEGCTVTALLWFYCEHVEGPFPSGVRLSDCTLRRGRGNPTKAIVFAGLPSADSPDASSPPRAVHDVVIENNRIYGGFHVAGVENVRITDNRFLEDGAAIEIRDCHDLVMHDNRDSHSAPVTP
ncbi:MAG: hypothetical protein GY851_10760 [bacterium]|nr:hypothetical protein [bacterium]